MSFPEPPSTLPDENRATGRMGMRYEDLTQAGRLRITSVPPAGAVPWREKITKHPLSRARETGVIPILSRLIVETGGGPIPLGRALDVEGCFQLAHTRSGQGEVERIILNVWADLWGVAGRTNGPQPPNAGERVRGARFYSEYVFTRPFAPAGDRKVHRLDMEGVEVVPFDRHEWTPLASVASVPQPADRLDDGWIDEGVPLFFGLDHTDSNQHVNSLVYPRLFEQAALRRLAAHDITGNLQATHLSIGYRKPAFAGDALRMLAKAYRRPGGYGVVGWFLPLDAEPPTKPHCYVRMEFSRFQ